MLLKFLFSNINFTLSVFSAFVFFITGWLYLDSSKVERNKYNLTIRSLGFFLLAFSAAAYATTITSTFFLLVTQWIEIVGLVVIILTLLKESMTGPPGKKSLAIFPITIFTSFFSLIPITAFLNLVIALIFFKKITRSFEKQLMPVFWAFIFLATAKILSIGFLWNDTTNVFLSNFLSDFGPLWLVTRLIEVLGLIILAKWTLGYIRFRLASQLFISIVSAALFIFLVTTIFFTFLLLRNVELDSLTHLETDVKVLYYSLESHQKEALSDVNTIAQDGAFLEAFANKNKKELLRITSDYLLIQNTNFLTVTDKSGNVVMRAEDKEKIGDNLGLDPVVKSALSGRKLSTIITIPGVFLPLVEIKAAMPITISGQVQGSVITGFLIDNAFVDGIKKITGLDVAVFAGNRRAATTFLLPDGKSRAVGTIESSQQVITKVLEKGEVFIGPSQVLNQSYYTAYAPLKTNGDKTIGMLFVGKQQTELIKAANRSLELTFIGSIILMILSIIPSYYISKYIHEQVSA
ncbi:MAG: cache domain-containing protein [Patescibacteria group bacterium]|jgi:hypothetical protein